MAQAQQQVPFWQVDAFVDASDGGGAFTGNPAAVCLLGREHLPVADATLQQIAAENNLAETAFVTLQDSGTSFETDASFNLRWFTPSREVPLCGHATLAAASVVLLELNNPSEAVEFDTLSGRLRVARAPAAAEGGAALLQMQLPLIAAQDPLPACAREASAPLVRACCGALEVETLLFAQTLKYLLIELKPGTSLEALKALDPDIAAIKAASADDELVGVIVSLATGVPEGPHLASRFFAPWAGIPEDPVTGSAHAVLGPHYSAKLQRRSLLAVQCSPRSGRLSVQVEAEEGRVVVSGGCCTMIRGRFLLPKGVS